MIRENKLHTNWDFCFRYVFFFHLMSAYASACMLIQFFAVVAAIVHSFNSLVLHMLCYAMLCTVALTGEMFIMCVSGSIIGFASFNTFITKVVQVA